MTFTIFKPNHTPYLYVIDSNKEAADLMTNTCNILYGPGHYWVQGYIITD